MKKVIHDPKIYANDKFTAVDQQIDSLLEAFEQFGVD
jgi:hypothetical protein